MQSGVKDCGLFTMRYMKEICENKELDFHAKVKIVTSLVFVALSLLFCGNMWLTTIFFRFQWKRRSNLVYTEDDINEVRIALAKFIMKHRAR